MQLDGLRNLKRKLVLEAIVEPLRTNKSLVVSGLVAGALGLAGSLVGCASAAVAGGVVKAASKTKRGEEFAKKILRDRAVGKLARRVHRDLQPQLHRLLALYLQAELPAVRVLAIREELENK